MVVALRQLKRFDPSWSLLTVGIGAYTLARSVDKIVPQLVEPKG